MILLQISCDVIFLESHHHGFLKNVCVCDDGGGGGDGDDGDVFCVLLNLQFEEDATLKQWALFQQIHFQNYSDLFLISSLSS